MGYETTDEETAVVRKSARPRGSARPPEDHCSRCGSEATVRQRFTCPSSEDLLRDESLCASHGDEARSEYPDGHQVIDEGVLDTVAVEVMVKYVDLD